MKKVTMETRINLGGRTLSVREYADNNIAPVAAYGEEKFVLVNEAWMDNNKWQEAAYFAHAVKIGDEITDGEAKLYRVEFEIKNKDTEDASEACNWAEVEDYTESDTVTVEE